MPTPKLDRAEAIHRLEAVEQALREGHTPMGKIAAKGQKGAVYVAAARLGMADNSGTKWVQRAEASAGRRIDWSLWAGANDPVEPRFTPPSIPADDIPVDKLIDQLAERFDRRAEHASSKKCMRFSLNDPGPYLLAFVGDPHLDDNGCNWPLLRRDIELMRKPHVHGVMLGDATNNWAGKLQRLYANQDVSRDRAWRLAEWFFRQVPWLLLVKGNHDLWSQSQGQGDPLDWMARGSAALENWQAKIEIVAGSHALKVWAAHDFKGSSLYNPLHGPMRAQRFSAGDADILAAGHQHHWELFAGEDADKSHRPHWLVRARGYKFLDDYADRHQFAAQQHGATIAAVVDPSRTGPAAVQCYADLAEAIEILGFKRKRWEAANGTAAPKRRR